ncbi:MAG: glutamate-5-semialdehyde dehydrogenase, partial [Armatimonadetes bacterium]|nr:glutamate-5-semialdehyde dehydrogenase [Armatimonadota bacterium]
MSHVEDPVESAPEALVEQAGRRARQAAGVVGSLSTSLKNAALQDIAQGLLDEADAILEANERDLAAAERARVPDPIVDRLTLTRPRLAAIADGVREVAAFADPVGEVLRGSRRPNGLLIQEVRVPLGVIGVIFESRPDVTIDAISLCLKAGNTVVLRGGDDVQESNRALLQVVRRAVRPHGIPDSAIELIESTHPRATERLLHLKEYVDVLIPRGSPQLIRQVCGSATLPTIETGAGNCHVFVERTARLEMAEDIAFNAKVQRPGAVNSMETLLVDEPIAAEFLPRLGTRMQMANVEMRGCER